MSRRPCPDLFKASELDSLKARRDRLLCEARRHRYRLHLMPDLTKALRETTTDLLRRELEDTTEPKPLGDAGPVGQTQHTRLPYRDD
jgi:hypothetical protein